ncbi:MAG: aminotransferase class I/II-fold pyridoxal phosphate-dependent enzyme [Lactobacillus sp.]|uniref:aminotransferase class I/II-fold pyridoxal phosphate-dependent enzyme n=1 Tax=Lactobacillus sp. TaxID=1591 RepID=UPI0023C741AA|nr:aminotransferase class I/II-fold pyridoxal phosphate-dependent enzyme [Lactobacillus sp.]MDE7051099.1 aminotransferase class I/II-fold pyridoxal phosphate-dependent enzyme [Lactobacillus sp.]
MPKLANDLSLTKNTRLNSLGPSKIRAFDEKASQIPGIIKLTIGEPDLNTPDHVKNAAIADIEANDSHYAPQAGKPELLDAISNYLDCSLDVKYDSKTEICVTVGATGALNDVFMSILNPGDKILVPTPVWALYFQLIKLTGAIPVQIDTSKDGFILTPEHLKSVLQNEGKGAKAIILTDPSNPTGRVYPETTLKALAEVISEYHLFSVTDEIYGELVYDNNVHHSLSQYIPERNILISGLSKAYAMTGWRLGYIAAPADIMKTIQKVNAFLVTSVTDNVQAAAIEALNNGQADPLESRKIYEDRLKFMKAGLEKLGFEMSTPQGAFYIFAKIPDSFGTDDEAFANELATKARVGVTPGRYFGQGGQGYVRMSYASSTEQLQEALKRIAEFVENI